MIANTASCVVLCNSAKTKRSLISLVHNDVLLRKMMALLGFDLAYLWHFNAMNVNAADIGRKLYFIRGEIEIPLRKDFAS
jgi:hypothetical protein